MQTLSLNGAWTVRQAGGDEVLPAQVPGAIHLDLLAAGRIPDPYYRDNEDQLQWIGEVPWIYERRFTVPEALLGHEVVLLRCRGLDTLATVVLNGQEVASTDNMFRTWEFDVTGLLCPGENTLSILFAPAPQYIAACQVSRELPCWANPREMKGRCWVRKEPSNFGWDWGPVLITCGIWRPIELVAFDTARLTDLQIRQDHAQPDVVGLTVQATVEAERSVPLSVAVAVYAPDGAEVAAGVMTMSGTHSDLALTVPQPQRWWPSGMGEQPLYLVEARLLDEAGRELDRTRRRIGLRHLVVERVQDAWGESFQFAVNGVPFFAKGANWIPADTFAPAVTDTDYARLLHDAKAANMNMIRAWGGGIYEEDVFYDLCDELGLCVWQDFIFACSTYPTFDEAFTQSVLAEVVDNVTRLRHHPCIALWCGNNELEQGLVGSEWSEAQMSWEDYTRLFDNMLPEMVQLLDPDRSYWPGSPHSPYGQREDYSNPRWGDAHLWEVWHKKEPFDWYRTAEHRFISEFGFQSFPEPATVERFTLPEDRNVTSYVMEHHQRSMIGNGTILTYMLDWFQLPTSFDMTLWLSQILQGIGMQYGVEHWRRSMPRTMGTLYWQLNDCWPVASWASIDYYGRWKALHYMAARFYAPLLVSGVEHPEAGTVDLYVTSDRLAPVATMLRWTLTDAAGTTLAEVDTALEVPAQSSRLVSTLDLAEPLAALGARDALLWLELTAENEAPSRNLVTFLRPKHLRLREPEITAAVREVDGTIAVRLDAQAPALWTWLELPGVEARWSDNFFHLRPGAPMEVTLLTPGLTGEEVQQRLVVNNLVDTYRAA